MSLRSDLNDLQDSIIRTVVPLSLGVLGVGLAIVVAVYVAVYVLGLRGCPPQ